MCSLWAVEEGPEFHHPCRPPPATPLCDSQREEMKPPATMWSTHGAVTKTFLEVAKRQIIPNVRN